MQTVQQRQQAERAIVRRVIREAKKAGYLPEVTWDGGEYVKTPNESAVMDAVFAVDEATVHFDAGKGNNGKSHGVFFVLGNSGWDVISDYHCGDEEFNAVLSRVNDYVDRVHAPR